VLREGRQRTLFLCQKAAGVTIAADAASDIRAGEFSGPSRRLVHTGEPWDDVVIDGTSTRLVLTGVIAAVSPR
jgi:hypothetical protein